MTSRSQTSLTSAALFDDDAPAAPAVCAPAVASAVREWRGGGYPGASPVTKRLLSWWFETDHEVGGLPFKFYEAQRAAVEALIYVHEIRKARSNRALLEAFLANPDARLLQHGDFARYAVKMATGSGKTMVMALATAWSYLNAASQPDSADRADYATSFLIIAPNVIVFERLRGDFEGGAIFREYPIAPPEFADRWGGMRFYMRGDRADAASEGALYLTNIQQLYDSAPRRRRPPSAPPGPIADLLGDDPARDAPEQRDDFVARIARRQAPCLVFNDEAHHTHDESSEWNRAIRRLRDRLGAGRFMAQADFSATPRFNDGTLFPWVICDYPLKDAIKDGIVKQPIRGEIRGAGEAASDAAAVRYEPYITAAVNRWREYRDQLLPLAKKPVLFAMMEDTKSADAVGEYLRQAHPEDFGGDKLQIIHVRNRGADKGEVSDSDLQRARAVVKDIDSDGSAVNAVVSVMMLREGWDVRNVTVVLGLRPYSAEANILPEQAIGRGLRLMFPGETGNNGNGDNGSGGGGISGYRERVDIIGTDRFIEFVRDLEKEEEIAIPVEDLEREPIRIVVVHPDESKADMDIAIPSLSPTYARKTDTRAEIARLDIHAVRIDSLPFSLEPGDEAKYRYLGLDALTDETLLARTYRRSAPSACGEVISYYASRVASEANLPGHFDVIADRLRAFFAERAFGRRVDLDDNRYAAVLAKPAVGFLTVDGFVRAIRPLLRQELQPVIAAPAMRLSDTPPFPWSRPTCPASKTVFNLVAGDNDFEIEFARFLESAPDVARFAKLPARLGFKIQYIANTGGMRHYYPDFVAVASDGQNYLIETKGMEDANVALKDRAASVWCDNAAALTGAAWRFVKVPQIDFARLGGQRLADAAHAFGRRIAD